MNGQNSTPAELENAPATWNGRLAVALATGLRELGDGNPHRTQAVLRDACERFIAESGCSSELAETVAEIARLPRVEPIR